MSTRTVSIIASRPGSYYVKSKNLTVGNYSPDTYENSNAVLYRSGDDYCANKFHCCVLSSLSPSLDNPKRNAWGFVKVSVSKLLEVAGIPSEYVSKINYSAVLTTGYSWSPSPDSPVVVDGLSKFQSAKASIGNGDQVVVPNGDDATATYESTTTVGDAILSLDYYTQGGNSNPTYDGIVCTSFTATITYEIPPCSISISATVRGYDSSDVPTDYDISTSSKSLKAYNDCSCYLTGGASYSGSCGTVAGTWQVSKDRSTWEDADINNSWYCVDSNPVYLRYKATDGTTTAYSGVATVNSTPPTITITASSNCNSVTASATLGKSLDSGFTYKYAIRVSSSSDYGPEQDSGSFESLSPSTAYTVIYRVYGSHGMVYAYNVAPVSTVSAQITDVVATPTCTSININATHTCSSTMTVKLYSDAAREHLVATKTIGGTGANFTGLSTSTAYYYTITATSTTEYRGSSSTLIPGLSLEICTVDFPDIHVGDITSDISIAYPDTMLIETSSNCGSSNPTLYKSADGTNWTSMGSSGSATLNLFSNWHIKAEINIGGHTYTASQSWVVSDPTYSADAVSTKSGSTSLEVSNGQTIDVFETGSYRVRYSLHSTWDTSRIVTKSYTYSWKKGSGSTTTVTTPYVDVSISSGGVYAITNSKVTYTLGSDRKESDVYSLYINPIVFTNGDVYAASSAGRQLISSGGNKPTVNSGEVVLITAENWGTSNITVTWSAFYSANHSTWINAAGSSYCNLYNSRNDRVSFQPLSTDYYYAIGWKVVSIDDIGQRKESSQTYQYSNGSWFICQVGIVPIVEYLPDPHVGAKNDTEFNADASGSYVLGQTFNLSYQWHLKDGTTTVDSKLDITSGSLTSPELSFKITDNGDYTLQCTISGTYAGSTPLTPVVWSADTSIKEITDTGIDDYDRFSMVFTDYYDNLDSAKCFVASRNNVPYFVDLKFGKYLSNIGTMTCTLIGLDRCTTDDGRPVLDMFDEPGCRVCILDRMNPVWIGIVTEASAVETNYYEAESEISMINITAYESTKELALDYVPNTDTGLIAGTLTSVAKKIIPESYQGQIGESNVQYGISISNTSRLTALDQLYAQAGWRYRCRPDTKVFWSSTSPSVDSGVIVVAFDTVTRQYGCFIKNGDAFMSHIESDEVKYSAYDGYLIDFKPSYYQTYNTRTWTVNYDATNVSDAKNIRDKFGTAIVYGVGYSGETIASNMKAWMKINPDYTIDNSMRITKSYDSELDSVVKLDDVDVDGTIYSRFTLTFNGWSFPDLATLDRLTNAGVKPRVYYVNGAGGLYYLELECLPSLSPVNNPRRYYDQAGNKKTAYVVTVIKNSTVPRDSSTTQTSVIESLVQLSSIIFPVFAVDKPLSLPAAGSDLCVGDMVCRVVSIDTLYSEVTIDYISPDAKNIPHGHLTDVLVMDNSGEYNYNSPHPESPYSLYGNTSLTTQGPEGYSILEMERLACRYMQYGSNYNSQGSAMVGAMFFYRNDYEIGTARLPMVGDRIALRKNEGTTSETIATFELQRYEFDMENYAVSIVFGMPIMNIGEVIYNLLSNAGMSIIPADS